MTFPADPFNKEATLAVFQASSEIGQYNPDASARFWFNGHDRFAELEKDINSTYLAAYTNINASFPSLVNEQGARATIFPGERIIILTSSEDPISKANASLLGEHVILDPIAYRKILRPGIAFAFIAADAKFDAPKKRDTLAVAGKWPIVVRTPAESWAYGKVLPMPRYDGHGDVRNGIVAIRTKLAQGNFWVGVLTRDGKAFLARRELSDSDLQSDTIFANINLKDAALIVVQNGPRAERGRIDIESASVLVPLGK